jgi:hypothetical protein
VNACNGNTEGELPHLCDNAINCPRAVVAYGCLRRADVMLLLFVTSLDKQRVRF